MNSYILTLRIFRYYMHLLIRLRSCAIFKQTRSRSLDNSPVCNSRAQRAELSR